MKKVRHTKYNAALCVRNLTGGPESPWEPPMLPWLLGLVLPGLPAFGGRLGRGGGGVCEVPFGEVEGDLLGAEGVLDGG